MPLQFLIPQPLSRVRASASRSEGHALRGKEEKAPPASTPNDDDRQPSESRTNLRPTDRTNNPIPFCSICHWFVSLLACSPALQMQLTYRHSSTSIASLYGHCCCLFCITSSILALQTSCAFLRYCCCCCSIIIIPWHGSTAAESGEMNKRRLRLSVLWKTAPCTGWHHRGLLSSRPFSFTARNLHPSSSRFRVACVLTSAPP